MHDSSKSPSRFLHELSASMPSPFEKKPPVSLAVLHQHVKQYEAELLKVLSDLRKFVVSAKTCLPKMQGLEKLLRICDIHVGYYEMRYASNKILLRELAQLHSHHENLVQLAETAAAKRLKFRQKGADGTEESQRVQFNYERAKSRLDSATIQYKSRVADLMSLLEKHWYDVNSNFKTTCVQSQTPSEYSQQISEEAVSQLNIPEVPYASSEHGYRRFNGPLQHDNVHPHSAERLPQRVSINASDYSPQEFYLRQPRRSPERSGSPRRDSPTLFTTGLASDMKTGNSVQSSAVIEKKVLQPPQNSKCNETYSNNSSSGNLVGSPVIFSEKGVIGLSLNDHCYSEGEADEEEPNYWQS